ncbi:hypothetical protein GOODEAATRI_022920, partial [Goodea atripinnis]
RTEVTFSSCWGTTFCLLLDLLEVLTTSGLICDSGVCLRSQRIPGIHSAALLMTVSCCSEYFVKKRTLLFLKRFLLQKLGDDWSLEGVLSTVGEHRDFIADRSVLAQSILKAVADNWLLSVQVEHAVFFGGVLHSQATEGLKPDGMMLRAIEVTHSCSWISLLFGEQDDDLMEAASAFLSIFLSYRRCSGLDDYSVLEAACASGCNPHCHFVLLLQSLSFDHSILLDFLISSETCFLEYFVRYLKYLRGDWQGFTAASGHRKVPLADSHGSELGEGLQPKGSVSPLEGSSLDVGLRLVEYDNSDESSEESPIGHKESKSPTAPMTDSSSKMKTKHSSSVMQSEQGCPTEAAPLEQETCDTLEKTVSCLSELREVVTRLQTKKLFPYNPSSLLKLLAQVETCQRSSLSV